MDIWCVRCDAMAQTKCSRCWYIYIGCIICSLLHGNVGFLRHSRDSSRISSFIQALVVTRFLNLVRFMRWKYCEHSLNNNNTIGNSSSSNSSTFLKGNRKCMALGTHTHTIKRHMEAFHLDFLCFSLFSFAALNRKLLCQRHKRNPFVPLVSFAKRESVGASAYAKQAK